MLPANAAAQVYRWTDEDGNSHYTVMGRGQPTRRRSSPPPPAEPSSLPLPLPSSSSEVMSAAPAPGPGSAPASAPAFEAALPASEAATYTTPPPEARPQPPLPMTPAVSAGSSRVAELEAQITQDKEALKTLISQRSAGTDLASSAELREIAERLPRMQSELKALRGQPTP